MGPKVAKWRKTVRVNTLVQMMHESEPCIIAAAVAELLNKKLGSEDDDVLQSIIAEFEDLGCSEPGQVTHDDLENVMSDLYDWADGSRVWLGI